MNVGFVFTNYNNASVTREAVRSIHETGDPLLGPVVIVDNKSAPADVAALRSIEKDFSGVTVLLQEENLGYFGGLNIGIQYIRRNHPKCAYLVVGNNDLVFPPSFGECLRKRRETLDSYAVVAPDLVTLDGVHQNPHVISEPSRTREAIWDLYFSHFWLARFMGFIARVTRRWTERKDYTQHRTARTIYQGYGACYVLTPKFFSHFEALWAPTLLMGEELFLSMQLKAKNEEVFYDPEITVAHHDHATMKKVPSRRVWELNREAHRIYRQHVRGVLFR